MKFKNYNNISANNINNNNNMTANGSFFKDIGMHLSSSSSANLN